MRYCEKLLLILYKLLWYSFLLYFTSYGEFIKRFYKNVKELLVFDIVYVMFQYLVVKFML